jgi:hypothetical protein
VQRLMAIQQPRIWRQSAFVRFRRCPFRFLSVFRVAERPVWLPRHTAIVALDDPQGVS